MLVSSPPDHSNLESKCIPKARSFVDIPDDDASSVTSDVSTASSYREGYFALQPASPSARLRANSPGFKDGDRFYHVDAEGNKLNIKMRKAKNDDHVPVFPRSQKK